MTTLGASVSLEPRRQRRPDIDRRLHPMIRVTIAAIIGGAVSFVAYSIYVDVNASGAREAASLPYLELFIALLIALGFAFVNGFHDTANAVATVIHTRSLTAPVAVVWSGVFNLIGVLLSLRV